MYNVSYAEVLDEAGSNGRSHERQAMEQAVALLRDAAEQGPRSRQAVEALLFTRRLWSILLEDLVALENGLPDLLKANIFSIGIWILGEIDAIRLERSENFTGIADVCETIAEGLS